MKPTTLALKQLSFGVFVVGLALIGWSYDETAK